MRLGGSFLNPRSVNPARQLGRLGSCRQGRVAHLRQRFTGAGAKPVRSPAKACGGSFVLTLRSHPKLPRQDRAFNSSSDRLRHCLPSRSREAA